MMEKQVVLNKKASIIEFIRTVRLMKCEIVGNYEEITYRIKKVKGLFLDHHGQRTCYVYLRKPINKIGDWKIYDVQMWNKEKFLWESFGANFLSLNCQSKLLSFIQSSDTMMTISKYA